MKQLPRLTGDNLKDCLHGRRVPIVFYIEIGVLCLAAEMGTRNRWPSDVVKAKTFNLVITDCPHNSESIVFTNLWDRLVSLPSQNIRKMFLGRTSYYPAIWIPKSNMCVEATIQSLRGIYLRCFPESLIAVLWILVTTLNKSTVLLEE